MVPVLDLDWLVDFEAGQPVQERVRVWVKLTPLHFVDVAGVQDVQAPQEQVELQLVSLTLQLPVSHEKVAEPV